MPIEIAALQRINTVRASRWHEGGVDDWSALEWAGAMAGEAGEACNFAKKLKRLQGKIQNIDKRKQGSLTTDEQALEYRKQIAKEAADTIIYALLLMERVGFDAEYVIRDVYNQKSEEYGFPERI